MNKSHKILVNHARLKIRNEDSRSVATVCMFGSHTEASENSHDPVGIETVTTGVLVHSGKWKLIFLNPIRVSLI